MGYAVAKIAQKEFGGPASKIRKLSQAVEHEVIIECPACQTKFRVEASKLQDQGNNSKVANLSSHFSQGRHPSQGISGKAKARFHCSRCDNVFSEEISASSSDSEPEEPEKGDSAQNRPDQDHRGSDTPELGRSFASPSSRDDDEFKSSSYPNLDELPDPEVSAKLQQEFLAYKQNPAAFLAGETATRTAELQQNLPLGRGPAEPSSTQETNSEGTGFRNDLDNLRKEAEVGLANDSKAQEAAGEGSSDAHEIGANGQLKFRFDYASKEPLKAQLETQSEEQGFGNNWLNQDKQSNTNNLEANYYDISDASGLSDNNSLGQRDANAENTLVNDAEYTSFNAKIKNNGDHNLANRRAQIGRNDYSTDTEANLDSYAESDAPLDQENNSGWTQQGIRSLEQSNDPSSIDYSRYAENFSQDEVNQKIDQKSQSKPEQYRNDDLFDSKNSSLTGEQTSGFSFYLSPSKTLGFFAAPLLILLTLMGTATLYLNRNLSSSEKVLATFFPQLMREVPSGVFVQQPKISTLTLDSGDKVELVKGTIVNQSKKTLSAISIEALGFSDSGEITTSERVLIGNPVSSNEATLKSLTPSDIRDLQKKEPKSFLLRPDSKKDFVLVFTSQPKTQSEKSSQMSSFAVRVHSARFQ
jgi:predicted Zn finger-like uncharacterized protein